MIEIVLASTNSHKVDEINAIANNYGVNFVQVQSGFNPAENGKTFEENAIIKASEASKIMKRYALADDTGLCVDALNGRPGLYSARYAPTQEEKIKKLLEELVDVAEEKRTARFVCTVVLTDELGCVVRKSVGVCEGKIAQTPYGNGGFGYDPLFVVDELGKTMAEMSMEEKNTLSHRAKALIPMLEWIKSNL